MKTSFVSQAIFQQNYLYQSEKASWFCLPLHILEGLCLEFFAGMLITNRCSRATHPCHRQLLVWAGPKRDFLKPLDVPQNQSEFVQKEERRCGSAQVQLWRNKVDGRRQFFTFSDHCVSIRSRMTFSERLQDCYQRSSELSRHWINGNLVSFYKECLNAKFMGQHKDIFSNLKDCVLKSFWLQEANIYVYVCVCVCVHARVHVHTRTLIPNSQCRVFR